ncbi:tetratricopeptide repeat protein [Kordia aestuariivivens]|nr:hypothetical protein [Kordia aestuariivivens]
MTTILVTTFCVFISFSSHAQNDCNVTLSLFAENVKTKNYSEATPQLTYLRENCATLNYAIYAHGEKVLKDKLKQATDKQSVALELIQLYTDRIKLFPEKTKKGMFLPKIGALMINYKIGTIEEQYNVFDEAFETDKANFKHPRYLYHYFELYYTMYTSGNHGISLEDLIEKYETINEKFAAEKQRLSKIKSEAAYKNSIGIDTFSKKMTLLVETEMTCEILLPMYREKFKANKNNAAWMRKAASKLDAKDCKDDTLFIELVEAIDALEPNVKSKFLLYKIHTRKGNTVKAKSYLEQYLALETDGTKKGNILSNLGSEAAKKGQKSKARNYYLDALKVDPSSGRTYLNIARLYGSSANECGTDEFSKRAIYWKAAEMARKATKVDPSVKSEANELMLFYMQSAPSTTDIFNKGYKGGEKIALKCWVGGHVIVPKL